MSDSAERPPAPATRFLGVLLLPWLCSTSLHATVFVALALTYGLTRDAGERVSSGGVRIEATFISGRDSAASDDAGAEVDNAGGVFYDDEPAAAQLELPQRHSGGGRGDAAALTALLNEPPAVSASAVLPAVGAGQGVGEVAGESVGTATGLTGEPQASNRLRGGYARTGVFGVSAEGRKFVYVFDRSGSMDVHGGAPLSAAKRELIASLKDLGQTHQFQIIFYNDHPRVFDPTGVPGRLVFGNEQNKSLAQKFVGSITADGATRHEEALSMALKMTPDVIFFLTDADEPRMSSGQLERIVHLNNGTSINTIEFGFGPQYDADNFLVKLARQNGGKHVYVDVAKLPAGRRQ